MIDSAGKIKKPRYSSLRSLLIGWFLIFSIVPLLFVAWYSLIKFEKAIDNELALRLRGNGREIEVIIADYFLNLNQTQDALIRNPHLLYNLSIGDTKSIQDMSLDWIKNGVATTLSIYDRNGQLLTTTFKDEKSLIKSSSQSSEKVLLNKKYLQHLIDKKDLGLVDYLEPGKVSLILFAKVVSNNQKTIGYIEQVVELKDFFLNKIKLKLKLDAFFVKEDGEVIVSTKNEFKTVAKDFLKKIIFNSELDKFFEFVTLNQPYGFILYPLNWDKSRFYIAIGVSKKESQAVLKNINLAFLSVIAVVFLLLVLTILITTKWFLRPINELIIGLRAFEKTESLVQLSLKNKTEIGLLTSAFNDMSLKIFQTRNDLKKKIKELELANNEIKEAQTKLVHSAKMTSLGQLVAGVAHELNNPIGFIYSNTSHLKEYTEKLFELIDNIEKNPSEIAKFKMNLDYDYIKTDLPQLIKSCQDGAQRTRDIVLGLRNFSRLEEAQLKEIDLRESLDTTLDLLKGEIKNKIVIHKNYEMIPKIICYASQINQVLMNILSNAIQAIQNSGQIWISTLPIKASSNQIGKVQISIQDSGAGMSPEVLEKIFEPFFTTKDVGRGTGLGLSISYGIIQNHGGEIQVKSELNVGTEFIIIIPISQENSKKTFQEIAKI